jgi:hypothetical protein
VLEEDGEEDVLGAEEHGVEARARMTEKEGRETTVVMLNSTDGRKMVSEM